MKNAKEMKKISDEHYLERYNDYIEFIEQGIEEQAKNGFYHYTWGISKDSCYDWTRSPLFEYVEELKKNGYQVEVFGVEEEKDEYYSGAWKFEIAWR